MGIRKALKAPISERHALAFLLACYFVSLLDTRPYVTGSLAYMRSNYGLYFVAFLTLYFGMASIACIVRRLSPLEMVFCSVPQWGYTCIGLWLLFKDHTAPLLTFFVHFGIFGVTVYLIHSRIRGIVEGHVDETLPIRPN